MRDRKRHEPDTTSVPIMSLSAAGLLALAFGGAAAVWFGFGIFVPTSSTMSSDRDAVLQQMTPGVKPNQKYERQQLQAEEKRILTEFRWQDEERKIARIPIEQAIKIMAERKLKTQWPAGDAASSNVESSPAIESLDLPAKEQP